MPRKEKRLMKWLVSALNTQEYANMSWKSRSKKELGIPWPRQKNKTWEESNSEVILGYIMMQKGYKDGDEKDFVKWKARFRTALNKEKALKLVRFDKESVMKIYRIVTDFDCDYVKPCNSGWESETNAASPESGYDSSHASIIDNFDCSPEVETLQDDSAIFDGGLLTQLLLPIQQADETNDKWLDDKWLSIMDNKMESYEVDSDDCIDLNLFPNAILFPPTGLTENQINDDTVELTELKCNDSDAVFS